MHLICGDALIDFLPQPISVGGTALPDYRPVAGGSCFNLALGLGRLGVEAGFMGGLSTDFFGTFLAETLAKAGVSLRYAARMAEGTTLAFVRLGEDEPEYAFFDRQSALRLWHRAASPALGPEVRLLHIGSVALTEGPAADECAALFAAEKGRRLLSIDPNCRPGLAADERAYRARLLALLAQADIIKLSVADLAFLLPGAASEEAARQWLGRGAALVTITRGAAGVSAFTKGSALHQPARPVAVIDTVGAGDSLMAGLLWQLEAAGRLSLARIGGLTGAELQAALAHAVVAAALTCGRRGADLPWAREMMAAEVISGQGLSSPAATRTIG